MDNAHLWSLRLGFSSKQADEIKKKGIKTFLQQCYSYKQKNSGPKFTADVPRNRQEQNDLRARYRKLENGTAKYNQMEAENDISFRAWWIGLMDNNQYPLREKMVLFFHNHFVASSTGLNMMYWQYEHNNILRENAFGNLRDITKRIIKSNAILHYLNNNSNVAGNYNENLSRELLELFTLGIGNYTEQDIKNGAKGLAGLTSTGNQGQYDAGKAYNGTFTYLGKSGNFKADEMVDIIFEQKNAPYYFTRKLLKWFIYDNPPESLVKEYGDYLRANDYELKPFLTEVFTKEYNKPTVGSKIKDPLVYILQLINELGYTDVDYKKVQFFIKYHGMHLYGQQNVKGWVGGRAWITAYLFSQRNTAADQLISGRLLNKNLPINVPQEGPYGFKPSISYNNKQGNEGIVTSLAGRLLFDTDDQLQKKLASLAPSGNAVAGSNDKATAQKLFAYIVKTPEFQII